MTGTSRAGVRVLALAAALALAACNGAPVAGPPSESATSETAASATATETPGDHDGHGNHDDHAAHDHEPPATAGTRSGPLTRRDFPRPEELGPTWSYAVDMGGPEDGFTGNGTPALERDPAEVALLAVPFGCPRTGELPVADHALEVGYTAGKVPVVAVRVAFADATTARRFFTQRVGLLRDCQGRVASRGEGVLVADVRRLSPTVSVNDRTPDSAPWTELAVRDGAHVVLLAAGTQLDRPPMTSRSLRSLTDAVRR